jgi:hypothetical protein
VYLNYLLCPLGSRQDVFASDGIGSLQGGLHLKVCQDLESAVDVL